MSNREGAKARRRWIKMEGMMTARSMLVVMLLMSSACLAEEKKARAERPEIVSAKEWGSKPQAIDASRKQVPKFITIHHAGVLWKAGDDPVKKLQGLQAYGQKEKGWPDVPYHFLIAPDGRIFEGRAVEYEPDTNTSYKTSGHIGVELWGNFEEQRPSKEQLVSLVRLTAWLAREYKVEEKNIGGHKDRAETDCPGRDLYRYFKDGQFMGWVKGVMEGKEVKIEAGPALEGGPVEEIPKK
jgi:hypothetical protein